MFDKDIFTHYTNKYEIERNDNGLPGDHGIVRCYIDIASLSQEVGFHSWFEKFSSSFQCQLGCHSKTFAPMYENIFSQAGSSGFQCVA